MTAADLPVGVTRSEMRWLPEALGLPDDATPFPWQEELLRRFKGGTIERSLDIPTGLGKTAVMAIWLVAQAHGARLPRRLVYVVDRRAVVDQATEVARGLRDLVDRDSELRQALGLEDRSLPISTLRGQQVDNKEWLEDPASLAIIVGTVDMIGSRLLFEGYGISRKMRPYHAGLMGADTLVVLDEAHLVPPFEMLLEAVAEGSAMFGPREEALRQLVPQFKLLSLSATGRAHSIGAFGLQDADLRHEVVQQRLDAPKRLTVLPVGDETKLADALAAKVWLLADNGKLPVRCIVFCDERKVAVATKQLIENLAKGDKKQGVPTVEIDTELFVGGRRVFEREKAAKRLKELGFIAGTTLQRARSAFLIATSAGEVGVDLDADHMVSDLVAWERMVQRLGRVNRRGEGDATVVVVEAKVEPSKTERAALDKWKVDPTQLKENERSRLRTFQVRVRRAQAVRELLDRLPRTDGAADASLRALRDLRQQAETDPKLRATVDAATTPAPLRPALSRALLDAWSMTSLKEHTGRPMIDPWLRGWIKDDPPQTAVVWRTHLPVRVNGSVPTGAEIEAFFEAAPAHTSELLETETFRVVEWLTSRGKALLALRDDRISISAEESETAVSAPLHGDDVVAVVLTSAGDLRRVLRVNDLAAAGDEKEAKEKLLEDLAGATLIIDARVAGLLKDGLLDESTNDVPRAADDGKPWVDTAEPSTSEPPTVRFRVRNVEVGRSAEVDANWRERLRVAAESSEDGEPTRWLIVEKWRHDAATEDDRSAANPQLLEDHRSGAERRARDLARRLRLPDEYAEMLAIAAYLHDEGKCAARWQRAFNASSDGIYAKTRGPLNIALLDGYRHELGSLPIAAMDKRLQGLRDDLRNLALHLIAAHHGFARPVIGTGGCEDAPPSALEERAKEVALRFARLQKRWGPWGLAWWEALLRAADQQASRDNDAGDGATAKGGTG